MKICSKCSTEFDPGKWNKLFCSRSCSNSRSFSKETNKKRSLSNQKAYKKLSEFDKTNKKNHLKSICPNIAGGPYTKIKLKNCNHCNKTFWSNTAKTVSYSTTCSDECFLAIKRKNRAGSKTLYNDEMYDSKWEADLAKWFNEQSILFQRPKYSIPWVDTTGKVRKYFPDFYIPVLDLYVDPKNKFCIKDQQEKLDYVSRYINLIYGEIPYLKKHIEESFKN